MDGGSFPAAPQRTCEQPGSGRQHKLHHPCSIETPPKNAFLLPATRLTGLRTRGMRYALGEFIVSKENNIDVIMRRHNSDCVNCGWGSLLYPLPIAPVILGLPIPVCSGVERWFALLEVPFGTKTQAPQVHE